MQLSPHFSLEEFVHSDTANNLGIDNTPSEEIIANLKTLAALLEQVRTLLGNKSIRITSGYRCPALNHAVGGVGDSAHMHGKAADIVCPDFGTPLQVCQKIAASGLMFDQLIHEFDSWTHIAWSEEQRQQILTINKLGTRFSL